MNSRHLRRRLEKLEELLAQRGLRVEAPIDVSETLTIISSIQPDMIRLSEIDRKRWYCPDDSRSILTPQEIEEEAKIKLRVLETSKRLGFPEGYSQSQYRKDGHWLFELSQKEEAADFIRLSASEQARKAILQARRQGLFEAGPKHHADLRIQQIDRYEIWGVIQRTVFEWHEVDHLAFLHPDEPYDEEELALQKFDGFPTELPGPSNIEIIKKRLDEWHARKGEDPRRFKTFATWMQCSCFADTLERQNKQLVEAGFEPDTTSHFAQRALANGE